MGKFNLIIEHRGYRIFLAQRQSLNIETPPPAIFKSWSNETVQWRALVLLVSDWVFYCLAHPPPLFLLLKLHIVRGSIASLGNHHHHLIFRSSNAHRDMCACKDHHNVNNCSKYAMTKECWSTVEEQWITIDVQDFDSSVIRQTRRQVGCEWRSNQRRR